MSAELLNPPVHRAPAPAKRRILETADSLFTDEGIRTVGVDRLIHDSRVTKATFYKHYGSKDRLVLDYIRHRHAVVAEELRARMSELAPEAALREVLAGLLAEIEREGFRGCPFLNAATEFPDPAHAARQLVAAHRDWYADTLTDLFRDLGHPLPGDAADDFVLARDGAMSGAYAGDPVAATTALSRAVDRLIAQAE
jgi:AcrR family transcriptional regulator